MVLVLAFGTFDIIHPGHHYFLEEAKRLGDELIVIIGRDDIVEQVKGRAPDSSAEERMKAVIAIPCVDRVEIGHTTDMYSHIERLRPDIIALGYDQDAFTENLPGELIKREIKAKIVRLPPFNEKEWKSSILRKRTATTSSSYGTGGVGDFPKKNRK